MLRLCHLHILNEIIEVLINIIFKNRDEKYREKLVDPSQTLCWIMVLLHYLGCFWIFVGSNYFVDYEEGHVPWTLANDDFKDIDHII